MRTDIAILVTPATLMKIVSSRPESTFTITDFNQMFVVLDAGKRYARAVFMSHLAFRMMYEEDPLMMVDWTPVVSTIEKNKTVAHL